ncbi:MAG: S41 family peptidase, partial [Gemmatimonadota bacterium]
AISRLAITNSGALEWAPDGTAVYYATGQRTKDTHIARVDLVKRTPAYRENKFWDLFKQPSSNSNSNSNSKIGSSGRDALQHAPRSERGSAAPARADSVNVSIDFHGIFDRLELLPLQMSAGGFAISPDGKTLVFQAQAEGQSNLYEWNLDPLAEEHVARQLTSTPGYKGMPIFSPDGKTVYFLDRGRISHVALKGNGHPSSLSVTAEMDVDFAKEKAEVFDEGWTDLRDEYFNPTMNGVDWPAVRKEFAPYIAGAQTKQELARLMNLMVGELNGSHLGAGQPRNGPRAQTGRLGLRFDPASLADGRFVIADVVPLGPADVAGITAGSSVTSIDGTSTRSRNLNELLANSVGKLVRVGVADARGRNEHVVEVKPISTGAVNQLEYRAWVEANRAYVDSISGGKLGYVAMPDMGWGSYQQLTVDLDAANMGKEGVVFDVRANRGGFVNAYAIDVLARQGYITMQERGHPIAPARSILGQWALERPTALVTNLNSLSDAEDFTEGYRTLKLGPVVGGPTGGWIIYTWGMRLVDGSSFRMPHSMIRGADGGPMELHPRPVDITVIRPLGESYSGRDSQLDAAVKALLAKIGS